MTQSQRTSGGKKPAVEFSSLIVLLRNRTLYPLLRALLLGDIERLKVPGPGHFTYRLDGDEVVANEHAVAVLVGSIGRAVGNPRLKVSRKDTPYSTRLYLSPKAQLALMLEMAAQLAHLSAHDLGSLPPPLDLQGAVPGEGMPQ